MTFTILWTNGPYNFFYQKHSFDARMLDCQTQVWIKWNQRTKKTKENIKRQHHHTNEKKNNENSQKNPTSTRKIHLKIKWTLLNMCISFFLCALPFNAVNTTNTYRNIYVHANVKERAFGRLARYMRKSCKIKQFLEMQSGAKMNWSSHSVAAKRGKKFRASQQKENNLLSKN